MECGNEVQSSHHKWVPIGGASKNVDHLRVVRFYQDLLAAPLWAPRSCR